MTNGEEAAATIITSWDKGYTVNGLNPMMGFTLEVIPDERPGFTAQALGPVQQNSVHKYQPGQKVMVRYNPSDTDRIILTGTSQMTVLG